MIIVILKLILHHSIMVFCITGKLIADMSEVFPQWINLIIGCEHLMVECEVL